MAQNHHHKHAAMAKRDISTIVSVVYVTAAPTFTGEIGGYVTLDGSHSSSAAAGAVKGSPLQNSAAASSTQGNGVAKGTPLQQSAAASSTSTAASSSSTGYVQPVRSQRPSASTTSTSTAVVEPSSAASSETSVLPLTSVLATSTPYVQQTTFISSVIPSAAAISSTALASLSATATAVADADEGSSAGSKAGIAIGVLLGISAICGLCYFFLRRKARNNNAQEKLGDEKTAARQSQASQGSNSSSSRFSLTKSVLSAPRLSLGPMMSEKLQRPASINRVNSLTNPFGDHAEAKHDVITDSQIKNIVGTQVPAPLSIKSDRPISPSASSTSSQRSAPSNVHRVQLDFKPSMDDELELRTGQIVRMLHEYDDGWALCKRLDGSQQGVVPRSCLSKHALKPRNAPPRPANGNQAPGHRSASGGSVSSVNTFASEESVPRPLSPAVRSRAQSTASAAPAQQSNDQNSNRQRSSTLGDASKIATPSPLNPTAAAGAVPNRKPVPGQAI